MLITPEDVTLLFDKCADPSLSTRKQVFITRKSVNFGDFDLKILADILLMRDFSAKFLKD